MDPILLQKQLKENNKDLEDFCKDLKNWGKEMKRKESTNIKTQKEDIKPTKSTKKRNKVDFVEPQKNKIWTYEQWNKFDADAECEKLDRSSESELSDEYDPAVKEEAIVEKEKGNRFVKNQKWDDAIKCYTKAIDLFAYDPIFYANRALCYLKKNEFVKAEKDCETSLKLDNTYVKAYQRRSAARESQNNLTDARLDLLRVLELEPNNTESKRNLEQLNKKIDQKKQGQSIGQKPVSKFSASRQLKKENKSNSKGFNNIIDEKKLSTWKHLDGIIPIKTIKKAPHLRSKKPLRRIKTEEINSLQTQSKEIDEFTLIQCPNEEKLSKPNYSGTLKSDDLKVIEHKRPENKTTSDIEMNHQTKVDNNISKVMEHQSSDDKTNFNIEINSQPTVDSATNKEKNEKEFIIPTTSVQFSLTWKTLDDNEKCRFLKIIPPHEIPNIFKESLDSVTFSSILNILATYFAGSNEMLYEYVYFLTQVKRFATMIMFMSMHDKNYLWKIFNKIRENNEKPKEKIDGLIKLYEL